MKVAIVEISESHEECIYSQVSFLKDAGYKVTLFAYPKIIQQAKSYRQFFEQIQEVNFDGLSFFKSLSLQIKLTKQLSKFDTVIFNTASSSKKLRNVSLFLNFYKTKVVGILHNAKRLEKSFTQKLFSIKIKKYFVLNDFIKENYKNISSSKLESFYPIYFPDFNKESIEKSSNEIWITIPGRLHYNRRNYKFLIEQLKSHSIGEHIKFIILGNINSKDGLDFLEKIEKHNLKSSFKTFNEFISNATFYSYLEKSDYILPLLNLDDESYFKSKITGTFNMAFGFKKTMICHQKLEILSDVKENGILYDENSFNSVINKLSEPNEDTYNNEKWTFEFQKRNYINFIKE